MVGTTGSARGVSMGKGKGLFEGVCSARHNCSEVRGGGLWLYRRYRWRRLVGTFGALGIYFVRLRGYHGSRE